mgnify:CR=1 FL=1
MLPRVTTPMGTCAGLVNCLPPIVPVVIFAKGDFWRKRACQAMTADPFPWRGQHQLFKRSIHRVQRCQHSSYERPAPRCMRAIDLAAVACTVSKALGRSG